MALLNTRLSALCALLLLAVSSNAQAPSSSQLSSSFSEASSVLSSLSSVASTASASVSTASSVLSSEAASSAAPSTVSSAVSSALSTVSSVASASASSSVSTLSSAVTSVASSAAATTASSVPATETNVFKRQSHSRVWYCAYILHMRIYMAVPSLPRDIELYPAFEALSTLPISSYPFSSFPVPSASPIPGTFPSTSPKSPPPPGSDLIPDFAPAWSKAHSQAKKLISGWSVEQKVNVSTGVFWMKGLCVGNIAAVGDFPGLCLEDSPLGVRDTDFVTAFPAGITVASTWNRTLLRQRGQAMGAEFKGKGVHVALGPMMNMGRIAQGGRNWEGFGADPYLTGESAYETVLGLQQSGVQACAKHYINNEQEHKRDHESSHVDDRTEHEIYLHPFMRSVQAGVASVMCSYNQINASWACENDRTLNQILKGEVGFQGYVQSDWGAHHSTLAAVNGLDMSMPGDINLGSGTTWWGPNLTAFVENGTIAESRLTDMAERIVAAWYLLDQDKNYPNGALPYTIAALYSRDQKYILCPRQLQREKPQQSPVASCAVATLEPDKIESEGNIYRLALLTAGNMQYQPGDFCGPSEIVPDRGAYCALGASRFAVSFSPATIIALHSPASSGFRRLLLAVNSVLGTSTLLDASQLGRNTLAAGGQGGGWLGALSRGYAHTDAALEACATERALKTPSQHTHDLPAFINESRRRSSWRGPGCTGEYAACGHLQHRREESARTVEADGSLTGFGEVQVSVMHCTSKIYGPLEVSKVANTVHVETVMRETCRLV
ncbi:hypothetical protein OH76DRAFT_1472179 [Lentinus brumalis]|uniref:beta-glucosidase n=1 Tax=Lentinus brumalis TaxID=2498619 RepID=A0A371D8T8_9APHY|nr:hypothetical protein OH76DRAFT_1472179 [Polyporus brumalis]